MNLVRCVWDPEDCFADSVERVDELLAVEKPGIGKLVAW